MSPELLQHLLSSDALIAIAPMLALCGGLCLLLLADVIPGLTGLRKPLFVATILVAAAFQARAFHQPAATYFMGSFHSSPMVACWGFLFLASALISWGFGQRYYQEERPFLCEHDVLMLTSVVGMMLMAGASDLLSFFVGLETLSVPLYTLAAFRRRRTESVEAGLKYFVLGAFAAGIFLYGAALLYAATGTLSLETMRALASSGTTLSQPLALAGIALVAGSLFFKVSVFPFHLWVPDVYQGAPTPVTTFMATGTKAAGFAFLLTFAGLLPASSVTLIALIAVLTMAVGNFGALVQTDIKRMLAYSGVAHAGTLLLAIAGMHGDSQPNGASNAILFYMAAYVFTAGGAFGLLAWLESESGPVTLESLRGLAQRRPGVAAAMAVFMLSLGGIPGTGGFFGKYFVFSVAVRAGLIPAAVIGALLSVVALGYYLRIVVAMYMQPAKEGVSTVRSPRMLAASAAAMCAAMVFLLGVLPRLLLERLG